VAVTFSDWSGWLLIPASLLASALAGGLLCVIPGVLKAWRGVNEVLSTLLLNYIVLQFFEWSIRVDKYTPGLATALVNLLGIKDPTQPYPQAADVPINAQLPTLAGVLQNGSIGALFNGQAWYERVVGTAAYDRITIAIVLGVAVAVFIYILLFKTTTGYRARAVGVNPEAARRMGIQTGRTLILTSFVSGALAGMAGGIDLLGATFRLIPGFLVGAGFSGIPVALIGQLHPLGVLLSALFFAALRAGGNRLQMTTGVPSAVVGVIQALVVLFVVAAVAMDLSTRMQKAQMAQRLQATTLESALVER
jgi:simple sugar transport system permease protein